MKIKTKVQERINEHLYNTQNYVEKMDYIDGPFNHQCFYNAIQYAKNHKEKVVMGIMTPIGGGAPVLHFWCKDNKNKHTEVSIGYLSQDYIYYEQRIIPERNWSCINAVFNDALDYWLESHARWHERLWLKWTDGRVV